MSEADSGRGTSGLRPRRALIEARYWLGVGGWALSGRRLLQRKRDQDAVLRDSERDRLPERRERHRLSRIRVDGVLPVLFVPLRHGGVLVHLLDDVAPADAGVVGAK